MGLLAVFFGGGAGSLARYLLSKLINENASTLFPLGTFVVNACGCFLIGLLFASFEKILVPSEVRLLLTTGFLGGFTTFSSFGLETVNLARGGEVGLSFLNVAISVIAGLGFVLLGMVTAGLLLRNR